MQITHVEGRLLRVPLTKPRTLPRSESPGAASPPDTVFVLLVDVVSDTGPRGFGFVSVFSGGPALLVCTEEEIVPRLVGCDPLRHEQVGMKLRKEATIDDAISARACAAIDIALWDLKSKAAGLPLWQLLGGTRESAPAYFAETAWPGLDADQILELARFAQEEKLAGFRVGVGGLDPIRDSQRVQRVRDAVGEEIWFGVSANHGYDSGTALAFGRFLEEELDADWFEDPIPADDLDGYARLTAKLDMPIAVGGTLTADRFPAFVSKSAIGIVRPCVARLGGITNWLRIAALAESFHRPIVPHLLPEVSVHLACGRSGVQGVDFVRWLEPLWKQGPEIRNGRLVPPAGPGLGLEIDNAAVERFRV